MPYSNEIALLLVDLQNDFCPGGSLAVPEGDAVMQVANELMPAFQSVIASLDWHPANHMSFAANHVGRAPFESIEINGMQQTLWPIHCVAESNGAALHPALDQKNMTHFVYKGTDPAIDSYSVFYDNAHARETGLHQYLKAHQVNTIVVMGLATDYCVLFSVLDALSLGYRVWVVTEGCRGVGLREEDISNAMQMMKSHGAEIVSLKQILSGVPLK